MEFGSKKSQKIEVGGVPRVNLLPKSVGAKRAQNKVFHDWGVRIVLAAAVVALLSGGMFAWQQVTAMQLQSVQTEGQNLLTQIAAKGEIQQLVAKERDLGGFRTEAMAPQIRWDDTLKQVVAQLPKDASLCAYELTLGATPAGEPEKAVGLSGTISICGPYPSAVPFLTSIKQVKGVISAVVRDGSSNSSNDDYTHTIELQLDQTQYTGEYAKEGGR